MWRHWMFSTALILVLASGLLARQGIVKTKTGTTLEGDVREKPEGISVTIRGIETVVPRDEVESVEYVEAFEKRFRDRLAGLNEKDAAGRIDAARWAFDNREYLLAREALQQALQIDPNSAEATTLMETVRQQMRLEQQKQERGGANGAAPGGEGAEPPAQERAVRPQVEQRFLSEEDINRIRQLELKPTDDNIRIRFANDVERRFASFDNAEASRFRNLKPQQKAIAIVERGDPDFSQDVHVLSDPSSLLEYRRSIQPMVLAGCASSGCHGGTTAGKLVLFSPASNDASTYSNFFILQTYAANLKTATPNVFGGDTRQVAMINRTQPEQSLLVQYGLPTDVSQFDHPEVAGGYRGMFRGRNDPRYQQLVDWIGNSLRTVEPNYGINYAPPTGTSPSTQPTATTAPAATQPAPAAGVGR